MTREGRKNWKEAHRMIAEILLREWDPIGVSDVAEAADEYDSYVPQIHGLLLKVAPVTEIVEYLRWAETKNMGLPGDRARTEKIAERLAALAESLPNLGSFGAIAARLPLSSSTALPPTPRS